ncbi:thiamin biosynthesis protein [Cellulomonas algicola]|uniref:Thiamin biosynthesis protein n=1 Tax=Cellulomonas algicola TaxID=2071633 RepID=A0A401V103_9CELL|nr:ThiF family adenylyltransferase [Cellulomonas algicola]GCD20588.1 thiamin biosynthesis protein [Cellulomonas algicola]
MRLRPGLRVLRRSSTEVQVGTDPRWAVRLTDLTPAEADAVVGLGDPARTSPSPGTSSASPAGRADLAPVSALLSQARLTRAGDTRQLDGPAAADAAAWSLLLPDGDGTALVRARSTRTAGVVGLGPTGLGVAVALAAAGVGRVLLDDERPVRSNDVGVGGYRWGDVGSRRGVVAARVLRDAAPRVDVDGRATPDVVVVVEHGAADPARATLLVGSGVPHLSVVVREGDTLVGPLVDPGRGPCLRCLDLHRTDVDPVWPTLVAQLVTAPGRADGPEVGVVAGVAASLAAAWALTLLDGTAGPTTPGTTYELGLPDALPRVREWAVHPDCGCTALPVVGRVPVPTT